MKNNVYELEFNERKKFFFNAMKSFLEIPSGKYEKLVFSHIWITCYHFQYCNDPLRTIAICLQISTSKTSKAINSLIEKRIITEKPYMIIN